MSATKLQKANEKLIDGALSVVLAKMQAGFITDNEFDMASFGHDGMCRIHEKGGGCGTAGCIGGWASVELGKSPGNLVDHFEEISPSYSRGLYNLQMMNDVLAKNPDLDPIDIVRVKHAKKAIENFLKGSRTPWRGVSNQLKAR